VLLSVTRTAVKNKVDPVHYLTAVASHAAEVRLSPESWLPWTYLSTLSAINSPAATAPPSSPKAEARYR
jgi:hypothetical protein